MSEAFDQDDTQEITSEVAVYESPWGDIRVGKVDATTLFIEFVRAEGNEDSLLSGILYVQVRGEVPADSNKLKDEIEKLVEQTTFKTGTQLQIYIDQHIGEIDSSYSIIHSIDNTIEGLYSSDGIDD